MKMIKVKSSNIESIGYDERKFQLFVEFKSSDRSKAKTFVYEDVSPSERGALLNADSVGKHFSSYIKSVKEGSQIDCSVIAGDGGDELHVKGKSKPIASPWISVDDELPVKGQECIVYSDEDGVMVETFEDRHSANAWLVEIQTWCGRCEERAVTHWMHLPEPPVNTAT